MCVHSHISSSIALIFSTAPCQCGTRRGASTKDCIPVVDIAAVFPGRVEIEIERKAVGLRRGLIGWRE